MANDEKTWRTFAGFVQFDPTEADAKGTKVTWFTIRVLGVGGVNIRVTMWPELADLVSLNKGDYVAVEGTYEERQGQSGQTYHNMTAKRLVISPSVEGLRGTANKQAPKNANEDDLEGLL